jgi:hypothetical protein
MLHSLGAGSLSGIVTLFHTPIVMEGLIFTICNWGLLLCLLCSAPWAEAQFVDLKAQIEFYNWSTTPPKIVNVHCIVGTNSWEMDGDFCSNCDQIYWFTGKQIIEHSVVTRPSPDDPIDLVAPTGEEVNRVSDSVDGNPGTLSACGPNGERLNMGPDRLCPWARVAWLAFCSGPCLKRPRRQIFPPYDLWKELICAPSGFSDRTEMFDDVLGLPKSVNLYAPKTEPVLQYRVVSSTNVLGWHFPLEFNIAQYCPAPLPESPGITVGTNGWKLEFTARGKLTAIGIGTKPQIPSRFVNVGDEQ